MWEHRVKVFKSTEVFFLEDDINAFSRLNNVYDVKITYPSKNLWVGVVQYHEPDVFKHKAGA